MNIYQYKLRGAEESDLTFFYFYHRPSRLTYIYGPSDITFKEYHMALSFYVDNFIAQTLQISDGNFNTQYYPFNKQPSIDDIVREVATQFPREIGLSDLLIPNVVDMSLTEFNEWYQQQFPLDKDDFEAHMDGQDKLKEEEPEEDLE